MNPLFRIVYMSALVFFIMVFGTAFVLDMGKIMINNESSFLYFLELSFYIFIGIYIIMIVSLYTCPNIFDIEYTLFFLLMCYYINSLISLVLYFTINLIVSIPPLINLIMYILVSLILTILGKYEASHTIFDKQSIKCKQLKGTLRIAHLTDIHLGAVYGREFIQKLVNMIITENVDFVVITGDLIDGNRRLTYDMIEPFSELECPIYFVAGNHEFYTWLDEALKLIKKIKNIHYIKEGYLTYKNMVNIIGCDYCSKNEAKYKIPSICSTINNNLPNILLFHVPYFDFKDLIKHNIFLFLTGHYHGGDTAPKSWLFDILKYFIHCKGIYAEKDGDKDGNKDGNKETRYIYVCNGAGTSGPCTRLGTRSTIGLIEVNQDDGNNYKLL